MGQKAARFCKNLTPLTCRNFFGTVMDVLGQNGYFSEMQRASCLFSSCDVAELCSQALQKLIRVRMHKVGILHTGSAELVAKDIEFGENMYV